MTEDAAAALAHDAPCRSGGTGAAAAPAASVAPGRWPVRLLMTLLAASGCGWFAIGTLVSVTSGRTPGVLVQAMPLAGIAHFAAALGLWERRRWAWSFALAYVAAGLGALAVPSVALTPSVPRGFLAIGAAGAVAVPALLRRRGVFSVRRECAR